MTLMVLDHVRHYLSDADFDPTSVTRTSVALFFTRWITHFCAPAFVFLAGLGAYLRGSRSGDRIGLARFLITRGAWLILINFTVVRLGWTFNLDYEHYLLGGVLWMIGWCMILLSPMVFLPTRAVGAVGLVIVFVHNLVDAWIQERMHAVLRHPLLWLWQLLYLGGPVRLGPTTVVLHALFTVVPWVGVMAAGYAFGEVMTLDDGRRRRICLAVGLGAVALYLVLRGFNLYGERVPWSAQSRGRSFTVLSFLNIRKYPPSLHFLLLTLGPIIALLPSLERARGRAADFFVLLGRVPFLFYVLHLALIHAIAALLVRARYGAFLPFLTDNHPMVVHPPPGYGYGLPVIYLVAALVIAILYWPCRWMAGLKARRKDAWLSYL